VSDTDILRRIDYALLGPTLIEQDLIAGCELAITHHVASCVVPPVWLPVIVPRLRGTGVAAGTVCGFPLGQNTTATKTVEVCDAVYAGADEVDMVMNYSALRSGYDHLVEQDIRAVVEACGFAAQRISRTPVRVKVILETCYLSEAQKEQAVALCVAAGASWVKTSTGLGPAGATVEDVALLRRLAPPEVSVKAAGGIRTVADCRRFLAAGADRLGTSATAAIAAELATSAG
jgi:deoxyribose-phosphate aldolase